MLCGERIIFMLLMCILCILTDIKSAWCLLVFKLQCEEIAGLTVMAEPQGHS